MDYPVEKWKRQDWRKGSRHYCCELKKNLFGQWILLRRWGRVSAFQGQIRETICEHYESGLENFEAVVSRREKRGYSSE
jgi:predicted DNA-binding WGR domain protein